MFSIILILKYKSIIYSITKRTKIVQGHRCRERGKEGSQGRRESGRWNDGQDGIGYDYSNVRKKRKIRLNISICSQRPVIVVFEVLNNQKSA